MAENKLLDWHESIVLIGYPPNFGGRNTFSTKTAQTLENLKDFLFIAIDDPRGFIKENYPMHLAETISSKDITDKEVIETLNRVTHCLLFWDGESLNKFVYQTLLHKKPCRIIPVQTTKVANKDRGDEYDVYIGRRGKWGNPYIIDKDGDRDAVIAKYKTYFYESIVTDPSKREALHLLKGKRLGCHCKPFPCHGDVIAEYLNALDSHNLD